MQSAKLKLASKIRADKKTKVATDPTLSFDVFSLSTSVDENFNIYQRLYANYTPPVNDSYEQVLRRRLKNFSPEDANVLLKLALSVLICPITQDPAMTAKFFENENRLLKRIFGSYLSATTIEATIISYRDREHDVFEEINQEIELTRGDHPLYPRKDFEDDSSYAQWRDSRLNDLHLKQRNLDKQPSFTGKLTVSVIKASGLNADNTRSPSSSVYFIVKVAEQSQRSIQYVNDTWEPEFTPEPYTFDVPSKDCRIKIELWDKNFIGSTFLGCVMAKPKDLMWIDQPYERWWPLGSRTRTKDTGVSGQLFIRFNLSFKIGPYRAPPNPGAVPKSSFSSFWSSSAPNLPSSSNSDGLSTPAPSSSGSSSVAGSRSPASVGNYNSFGGASNPPNSASSSPNLNDPEALPAPPPIVNSHLNNFPEWHSSLLLLLLTDAFHNPPPQSLSDSDVASNDSLSSSSANASSSGIASTPLPILSTPAHGHSNVPPGYGTPSRLSPTVKPLHFDRMAQNGLTPAAQASSSYTPGLNFGRDSGEGARDFGHHEMRDLNREFDEHRNDAYGVHHDRPSNMVAPVPYLSSLHSSTHNLSRDRGFTPGPPIAESPRVVERDGSRSDSFLSSSTGSLNRSGTSLRNMTPIKKLGATKGTTGGSMLNMTTVPEEDMDNVIDPVKVSPESQWLLDRFAERFSIDPCLPPLLMLEVLDQSFTVRSVAHLEAVQGSLIELESQRGAQPLLWLRVAQLYERVVMESLKNRLDDALTNYFLRFPRNEPKGALSLAIVLYSLVTKYELPQLCVVLHDKIESNMMRMYKMVISDKVTESALLDATRFVSQAFDQDLKYFHDVFPADLLLSQLSMRTYYAELLSKNVKAWLRTSPPISDITMLLYSYLGKLNTQLAKHQPSFDLLQLSTLFQPFVGKWIDHLGDNLPAWCRYDLLRKETWRSGSSQSGSHSSGSILHSPSVQILFEAFNRVYQQYRQFDMRTAKDLKAMVKIFVQSITAYMQVMAAKAIEVFGVQGTPKGVQMGGGRNSPVLRHSPSARFRATSAGDVYALATASGGINPSSVNIMGSGSRMTGPSPPSSTSVWSSFGIIPNAFSTKSSTSSSTHHRLSTERNLFHIPVESCVWISTLETLSQRLYDFCKQVAGADGEKGSEEIRTWFNDTFSQLNQLENQICQLIIKQINTNPSLELALDNLLSYSPDLEKITDDDVRERLEPLFDYIDSRVDILSAHLDYKVFLRLLELIWLVLIKDIEVLTFPIVGDRKAEAKRTQFIEYALPFLISFLEGKDGEGLANDFLEGEAVVLRTGFGMLKVPTGVLCKAYTDITNGLYPAGIPNTDGLDLLILETHIIAVLSMRKNDKEAKKFVKTNKANTMNRVTLRAFDLPKGETVVEWFTCRKGKEGNIFGYLYITTNWICFDTYLWGDHQMTIPISEIRSLKRKKTTFNSNGITIRLRDGTTTLQFSGLNKTKAYDVIVEQANKLGLVLETYDKNTPGHGGSASAAANGDSPPVQPSSKKNGKHKDKSGGQHFPADFYEDALKVGNAKSIDNEDDMRGHFGLTKQDEAIAMFDCALSLEQKQDKERPSSSLGTANPSSVGVMYCFSKTLCFRSATHKLAIPWAAISNLGQRGTDGILIVSKEKKKPKTYCLTKFVDPDDVFALMHSIWVIGKSLT